MSSSSREIASRASQLQAALSGKQTDGNNTVNEPSFDYAHMGERSAPYCGLENQGATCFLNSLLQTWFMYPELRQALLATTSTDPITVALQKMFVEMTLTKRSCIPTVALTKAFNWTTQVFQQADALELYAKLIEVLELHCTDPAVLQAVQAFSGRGTNRMECTECGHENPSKVDLFNSLMLNVEGNATVKQACLEQYEAEVFNKSNQWRCPVCTVKVDALRHKHVTEAPYVFVLGLQRITYDRTTWMKKKVTQHIHLDATLEVQEFEGKNEQKSQKTYELFSVLAHQGGAHAGHNFAYIKDFETGEWFLFNDGHVTPLTDAQRAAMTQTSAEPTPPESEEGQEKSDRESKISTETKTATVSFTQPGKNGYLLFYRLVDKQRNLQSVDTTLISDAHRAAVEISNAEYLVQKAEYDRLADLLNVRVFAPYAAAVDIDVRFAQQQLETCAAVCVLETQRSTTTLATLTALVAAQLGVTDVSTLVLHHRAPDTSGIKSLPGPVLTLKEELPLFTYLDLVVLTDSNSNNSNNNNNNINDSSQIVKDEDNLVVCAVSDTGSTLLSVPLVATDETVRAAAAQWLGLPVAQTYLAFLNSLQCKVLIPDAPVQWLRGDEVYIAALDAKANTAYVEQYDKAANTIKLQLAAKTSDGLELKDQFIVIDSREPLALLKTQIASLLQLDLGEFLLKRSANGKQMKNLSKSLQGHGLLPKRGQNAVNINRAMAADVDCSIFVEKGVPMGPNDVLLRIYMRPSSQHGEYKQLGLTPASTAWSSLQLKQHLQTVYPDVLNVLDPKLLRVWFKQREKVTFPITDVGTVKEHAFDITDGQQLAVEVLKEPETLTASSILLTVYLWLPEQGIVHNHKAELAFDSTSGYVAIQERLASVLATHFEIKAATAAENIRFAQVRSFHLNDSLRLAKLKWERSDIKPDSTLSTAPWRFGHGSLLIFKDASLPDRLLLEQKKNPATSANSNTNFLGGLRKPETSLSIGH